MTRFMENEDGVHLKSPLNSELSMCGDAFEGEGGFRGHGEMRDTRKFVVTCARCIEVIKACRGVRLGRPVQRDLDR